jgi:DNA-binding transcriptional LysR family regulator
MALHILYPEIHIKLLVSNQEFNMSNRQADITMRATLLPPEHLIGRQVITLNWSVFGSQIYEDKFGLPKNINELVSHSLIGAIGGMCRLPAFIWLEKNFAHQFITRCGDLTAMSYFVESGQSLAFLSDDQLRPKIIKRVMQYLTKTFSQERPV